MKKHLNILLAIAVILMGLTACQKSTKDQLVGTWQYTQTGTGNDGTEYNYSGIATQNEDGTYTENANVVVSGTTEIEGVTVQIKVGFSIKMAGDWIVNDKEIVYSPKSCGIKVTSYKYYDSSDGSYLGELTGNDLTEVSKSFAEEAKAEMLEASTERIIMLQENKYVTESTDDDGKKSTATYLRVR